MRTNVYKTIKYLYGFLLISLLLISDELISDSEDENLIYPISILLFTAFLSALYEIYKSKVTNKPKNTLVDYFLMSAVLIFFICGVYIVFFS
ncbi:hypothetical protein ACFFJI_10300 [Allobacillus sp. GCM10007491]|uniref:Uncharacterized protein n=1 Tax=Allobacillus saliphilus TaxID=2912308 RepID=A0A941CU55_9BACI|nr:hypothetical protein [Allobacillus saliphilus]MBR7552616.1 hypothetical protein [Allobacillus saliphilus]